MVTSLGRRRGCFCCGEVLDTSHRHPKPADEPSTFAVCRSAGELTASLTVFAFALSFERVVLHLAEAILGGRAGEQAFRARKKKVLRRTAAVSPGDFCSFKLLGSMS